MLTFSDVDTFLKQQNLQSADSGKSGLVKYTVEEKSVAYISKTAKPLRLSFRCNKELGRHLSEKYESVMPGHKLDPSKWITVVASGQLTDDEILDLLKHAVSLAQTD